MKIDDLMKQQSQYNMNGDYCDSHNISMVDDECMRGPWLSSRGAVSMLPVPEIDRIEKSRLANFDIFVNSSKKLGVVWEHSTPVLIRPGHGHIPVWCDGVILSGLPDLPNEKFVVIFKSLSKVQLNINKKEGHSFNDLNKAQILMACSESPKCLIVSYSQSSGEYDYSIISFDRRKAVAVWENSSKAVEMKEAPNQLPTINNKINPKCERCEMASICMAPIIPKPTCRNCRHSVFGPKSQLVCAANNNFNLNPENILNLHKCGYHRYNENLIASWAVVEEIPRNENSVKYHNLLNGGSFVNGCNPGEYSSYEMSSVHGVNGAELIGDKGINSIKKVFGAEINDKK